MSAIQHEPQRSFDPSLNTEARAEAAFQVILLGNSGGPREDNVSGLLVRSLSKNWEKGSLLAVDGGTLLSGIIRILENSTSERIEGESGDGDGDKDENSAIPKPKLTMTSGPFAGLKLPFLIPQYNAHFIFRHLLSAILITHPHLDHIAGLIINTPLIDAQTARTAGPKRILALSGVIDALKAHIFNDVIWPNLADEDGGVGLVSYRRLVDGGDTETSTAGGGSQGYVEASEGLATKSLSLVHRSSLKENNEKGADMPKPTGSKTLSVTESSAFFVRDDHSGAEILVFGDLEPDSISLDPRARFVWQEAAQKLAHGRLRAVFVECSYPDAISDDSLYGHLCPRHVVAELRGLAERVRDAQEKEEGGGSASENIDQTTSGRDDWRNGASLRGLRVFIIHVKEEYTYVQQPRETILGEVRALARENGLQCEFASLGSGDGVFL